MTYRDDLASRLVIAGIFLLDRVLRTRAADCFFHGLTRFLAAAERVEEYVAERRRPSNDDRGYGPLD